MRQDDMKRLENRIIWLYEKSHLKQPFIKQALNTLCKAGHDVTLINMLNSTLTDQLYRHVSLPRTAKGLFENLLLREYGAYKFGLLMPLFMLWHCLRLRPVIVMACMPVGLMTGWILKKLAGCRLVYYPMEIYGEQKGDSSGVLRWIEHCLVRSVDALVTQNESRGEVYSREYGLPMPPTVVHNYKEKTETAVKGGLLRSNLDVPESTRIVLYEGMITPGRWLDRLVEAVPLLPEDVVLVLLGKQDNRNGWLDRELLSRAETPGAKGRVFFVPWVKPEKLLRYVADADVGVIIYDDSVRNHLYCEPGKLSDYVLSGLPVVTPSFETIAPVVRRLGVGEVFESGSALHIAAAIARVLAAPADHYGPSLAKASEELVWATQEPKLLQAVLG
jgi:glycosyltransferase involved in cell wall biosynthesis